MDYIDLLLLIISGITCFYTSIVIFRLARSSPIPLIYILFGISILALGLNFLIQAPILIFEVTPVFSLNLTHHELLYLLRLAHICAIIFVLGFTIVTYLPSLKLDLKSISLLIISTFFATSTFIIDIFTLDYVIENDRIHVVFNRFGQISLLISLVILIYVLIVRYQEIGELLKITDTKIFPFENQFKSRNIFYFLIISIIAVYVFGKTFPVVPNFLYAGFVEIGVLYLIYALKKNHAFYFITNSKLDGVVILNSSSGKVQYYKNYQNVDVLLTSVVTAFNISIKQLVSSSTDIQQIILQDKSLLLSKGKFTTTILLVDKKTIISDLITNYLSKKFEKTYKPILEQSPYGVDDMMNFKNFDLEVDKIKNYFSHY